MQIVLNCHLAAFLYDLLNFTGIMTRFSYTYSKFALFGIASQRQI